MKVTQAEGFGKTRLFGMLDELERRTRDTNLKARARLASEKGEVTLRTHHYPHPNQPDAKFRPRWSLTT